MVGIPKYANLVEQKDVNYLCLLRQDKNYDVKFVRDRKVIAMRNCFSDGQLIPLEKSCDDRTKVWVPLTVRTFSIEGNDEPVPVCHVC